MQADIRLDHWSGVDTQEWESHTPKIAWLELNPDGELTDSYLLKKRDGQLQRVERMGEYEPWITMMFLRPGQVIQETVEPEDKDPSGFEYGYEMNLYSSNDLEQAFVAKSNILWYGASRKVVIGTGYDRKRDVWLEEGIMVYKSAAPGSAEGRDPE